MYMKPIVELDIAKIIDKFNPNKSAGYENIGNFIIKKVKTGILKPLAQIFNLSLSSGVVPEKLKVAKVIPIYKKDDSALFSNYRPVSLLPCFSKILERLVFNPSSPKGGCTNPLTVFALVLKIAQPRGKIAPGTFKFILSLHFCEKIPNLPSTPGVG